jgi:hypothetical protein
MSTMNVVVVLLWLNDMFPWFNHHGCHSKKLAKSFVLIDSYLNCYVCAAVLLVK